MKNLGSQIFTGDETFPFEVGTTVTIPGGAEGVIVMGSSKHETDSMGEYFLLRVALCDEAGDFDEDDWEIFNWAYGKFLDV